MSLTGKVSRWINRKGFGFVNVVTPDSEHFGNDLFVHLSGIKLDDNEYKSLFPGEYVNFDVSTSEDGRPHCVNLTGVFGGPLLIQNKEYRYKLYPKNSHVNTSSSNNDAVVDETIDAVVDAVVDDETQ